MPGIPELKPDEKLAEIESAKVEAAKPSSLAKEPPKMEPIPESMTSSLINDMPPSPPLPAFHSSGITLGATNMHELSNGFSGSLSKHGSVDDITDVDENSKVIEQDITKLQSETIDRIDSDVSPFVHSDHDGNEFELYLQDNSETEKLNSKSFTDDISSFSSDVIEATENTDIETSISKPSENNGIHDEFSQSVVAEISHDKEVDGMSFSSPENSIQVLQNVEVSFISQDSLTHDLEKDDVPLNAMDSSNTNANLFDKKDVASFDDARATTADIFNTTPETISSEKETESDVIEQQMLESTDPVELGTSFKNDSENIQLHNKTETQFLLEAPLHEQTYEFESRSGAPATHPEKIRPLSPDPFEKDISENENHLSLNENSCSGSDSDVEINPFKYETDVKRATSDESVKSDNQDSDEKMLFEDMQGYDMSRGNFENSDSTNIVNKTSIQNEEDDTDQSIDGSEYSHKLSSLESNSDVEELQKEFSSVDQSIMNSVDSNSKENNELEVLKENASKSESLDDELEDEKKSNPGNATRLDDDFKDRTNSPSVTGAEDIVDLKKDSELSENESTKELELGTVHFETNEKGQEELSDGSISSEDEMHVHQKIQVESTNIAGIMCDSFEGSDLKSNEEFSNLEMVYSELPVENNQSFLHDNSENVSIETEDLISDAPVNFDFNGIHEKENKEDSDTSNAEVDDDRKGSVFMDQSNYPQSECHDSLSSEDDVASTKLTGEHVEKFTSNNFDISEEKEAIIDNYKSSLSIDSDVQSVEDIDVHTPNLISADPEEYLENFQVSAAESANKQNYNNIDSSLISDVDCSISESSKAMDSFSGELVENEISEGMVDDPTDNSCDLQESKVLLKNSSEAHEPFANSPHDDAKEESEVVVHSDNEEVSVNSETASKTQEIFEIISPQMQGMESHRETVSDHEKSSELSNNSFRAQEVLEHVSRQFNEVEADGQFKINSDYQPSSIASETSSKALETKEDILFEQQESEMRDQLEINFSDKQEGAEQTELYVKTQTLENIPNDDLYTNQDFFNSTDIGNSKNIDQDFEDLFEKAHMTEVHTELPNGDTEISSSEKSSEKSLSLYEKSFEKKDIKINSEISVEERSIQNVFKPENETEENLEKITYFEYEASETRSESEPNSFGNVSSVDGDQSIFTQEDLHSDKHVVNEGNDFFNELSRESTPQIREIESPISLQGMNSEDQLENLADKNVYQNTDKFGSVSSPLNSYSSSENLTMMIKDQQESQENRVESHTSSESDLTGERRSSSSTDSSDDPSENTNRGFLPSTKDDFTGEHLKNGNSDHSIIINENENETELSVGQKVPNTMDPINKENDGNDLIIGEEQNNSLNVFPEKLTSDGMKDTGVVSKSPLNENEAKFIPDTNGEQSIFEKAANTTESSLIPDSDEELDRNSALEYNESKISRDSIDNSGTFQEFMSTTTRNPFSTGDVTYNPDEYAFHRNTAFQENNFSHDSLTDETNFKIDVGNLLEEGQCGGESSLSNFSMSPEVQEIPVTSAQYDQTESNTLDIQGSNQTASQGRASAEQNRSFSEEEINGISSQERFAQDHENDSSGSTDLVITKPDNTTLNDSDNDSDFLSGTNGDHLHSGDFTESQFSPTKYDTQRVDLSISRASDLYGVEETDLPDGMLANGKQA